MATLENIDSVNSSATEMTVEKEQVPCKPCKGKEELGDLLLSHGS